MIALVNGMLVYLLKQLVFMEKQSTRTHYNISVAKKLIYAQSINTGLLILATNMLVNSFNLTNVEFQSKYVFQRQGGISDDFFSVSVLNAFIFPITSYIDVFHFHNLYKQWRIKKAGPDNLITQREANEVYQNIPVELFTIYAHIVKTVWITFFYAALVPISMVFALFGLLLYYWVQKYLIINRYCRPFFMSADLNKEMVNMIEYSPIFMAAGAIWFDYAYDQGISNSIHILNFVSLGIACMELILPAERFNRMCCQFSNDDNKHAQTYQEVCYGFPTDYDRENPITQDAALDQFLHRLHSEANNKNLPNALNMYAKVGGLQRKRLYAGNHFGKSPNAYKPQELEMQKLKQDEPVKISGEIQVGRENIYQVNNNEPQYTQQKQMQSPPIIQQNIPQQQIYQQQQQQPNQYPPIQQPNQYPIMQPNYYPLQQPNQYSIQQPNQYSIQQPNQYPIQQPNKYPMNQPNQYPMNQPNQYPMNQPNQYLTQNTTNQYPIQQLNQTPTYQQPFQGQYQQQPSQQQYYQQPFMGRQQ